MNAQSERRKHLRQILPTPEVGIVHPHYGGPVLDQVFGEPDDTLVVYLLNISEGGVLLESLQKLEVNTEADLWTRFPQGEDWQGSRGRVVWNEPSPMKFDSFLLGVEFLGPAAVVRQTRTAAKPEKRRMLPADLEFFMSSPIFGAIPVEAICPLLNCMTPIQVRAGERVITQGNEGDTFYIIQQGSCVVSVEKDRIVHSIARLGEGDLVGEIALLTGEPRTANVDAETDMILWGLTRERFDTLCSKYSDLVDFLTELVTYRFSTEKVAADRSIGKYVIKEVIGRGGWSMVYKGVHKGLNMPVAIKMLKHDMAMNDEFLQKFRNEARIVALFNHENIVKVYDIEELFRTVFIIMEYLEGVPLDHALAGRPRLSVPKVLDILLQVCSGLSYAHEQGIVHQDIKPANIFIQNDDRAKIVDFGLSCPTGTVDCSLPGTVYYMSPEQIEGQAVDERADIYSLGIMAYEMLTGQRPFVENDYARLMNLHVRADIPDPRKLVPDLPDELHYFIKRATQKDPALRYKSCWEMIRDLQPFAEKMGVERRPQLGKRRKMMSIHLFYQDEQQLPLSRLVEKFNSETNKMNVEMKVTNVDDV